MSEPNTSPSTPPSHEVLGEAARRVAQAYPSLYEHQRSGVAFLLFVFVFLTYQDILKLIFQ